MYPVGEVFSCSEVRPLSKKKKKKRCPWSDSKLHLMAQVLGIWGIWSNPSLPLLPGQLGPEVVVTVKLSSMNQIELFENY